MAQRKKFLLRMSPTLWDELNRWAAQEFRSVNGQIEFLLQRAVDRRRKAGTEGETGREDRADS
jgi:hypothetical protein